MSQNKKLSAELAEAKATIARLEEEARRSTEFNVKMEERLTRAEEAIKDSVSKVKVDAGVSKVQMESLMDKHDTEIIKAVQSSGLSKAEAASIAKELADIRTRLPGEGCGGAGDLQRLERRRLSRRALSLLELESEMPLARSSRAEVEAADAEGYYGAGAEEDEDEAAEEAAEEGEAVEQREQRRSRTQPRSPLALEAANAPAVASPQQCEARRRLRGVLEKLTKFKGGKAGGKAGGGVEKLKVVEIKALLKSKLKQSVRESVVHSIKESTVISKVRETLEKSDREVRTEVQVKLPGMVGHVAPADTSADAKLSSSLTSLDTQALEIRTLLAKAKERVSTLKTRKCDPANCKNLGGAVGAANAKAQANANAHAGAVGNAHATAQANATAHGGAVGGANAHATAQANAHAKT